MSHFSCDEIFQWIHFLHVLIKPVHIPYQNLLEFFIDFHGLQACCARHPSQLFKLKLNTNISALGKIETRFYSGKNSGFTETKLQKIAQWDLCPDQDKVIAINK